MATKKKAEPKPKTYTVVGPAAVFGCPTGETFERVLSEFDEARLIKGGHIKPATNNK